MKIVVTGGAGFIGANLCREFESRPGVKQVVALDNLSTGSADNLIGIDAALVEGSILDQSLLRDTFAGADAVVHLAARPSVPRSVADPIATHEANVTGTIYVLEACRREGIPLIAASSSSVYGPTLELPKHEDMPTRPQSPYAASKLAAEAYLLAYSATYQLPALALRFFNVFGPLQSVGHAYAAVIPAFIDAALRGQPLRVHGDGQQTRDFTYVGSVVRILADAAEGGIRNDTAVNLAFGTRTSILDVVSRLKNILGCDLQTTFEPSRKGDVRDSQAADDRLRQLFPGQTPISLDWGLVRTVEWYQGRLERVAAPAGSHEMSVATAVSTR